MIDLARMAAARRHAGVELTADDLEALRRDPDPKSTCCEADRETHRLNVD